MSYREYRILKAIARNSGALLVPDLSKKQLLTMALLDDRGYVMRTGVLNLARYELTDEGHVALADYQVERKRRIFENVRYWITTAIAVAALIVSIFALGK